MTKGMIMVKWELSENVVSQDFVELEGVGDNITYTLHYFTYANEWNDRECVKVFTDYKDFMQFYEQVLGRGDLEDDYSLSCAYLALDK